MHRLRSRSAVIRFRLAALLVCAKCILSPAAAGTLVYAVMFHDKQLMMIALAIIVLAVCAVFFQWIIGTRTNCPLCITPVLSTSHCTKNRHAKTLFGSHRLRVSLAILFTNSFRCPYCNEPTAIQVRSRRQPHYSRS